MTVSAMLCADGWQSPQHRSVICLTGPSGTSPAFLEAFAAIVTPRAAISTPRIDLGTTFLGVTVKSQVWNMTDEGLLRG
jgi:hypothetical protein